MTNPPPSTEMYHGKLSEKKYASLLGECHSLDSLRKLHASIQFGQVVFKTFSKAAYSSLLPHCSHDEILAFLVSDLNHDDAANTCAYLTHLVATKACNAKFNDLVRLMCDKIAVGTIPLPELAQILVHVPKIAQIDGQLILDLYATIRQFLTYDYCASRTQSLAVAKQLLGILLHLEPSVRVANLITLVLPLVGHRSVYFMSEYVGDALVSKTANIESCQSLPLVLAAIPPSKSEQIIFFATKKFITHLNELMASGDAATRDLCSQRLVRWLDILRASKPKSPSPGASQLYSFIALHFTIPQLAPHFSAMKPLHAGAIILHNWIKPTLLAIPDPDMDLPEQEGVEEVTDLSEQEQDQKVTGLTEQNQVRKATNLPEQTQVEGGMTTRYLPIQPSPTSHSRKETVSESCELLRYTVARSSIKPSTHTATLEVRQAVFDEIASTYQKLCKPKVGFPSRGGAWVHLFTLTHQHNIDYAGWLDQLFQALKFLKSPTATYHLFLDLVHRNIEIPYPLAVNFIRSFLEARKVNWALAVFLRPNSRQWLSGSPELLFSLIDTFPVKSEFVFDLVNRSEYAGLLPKSLRSGTHNALSLEKVQLLQQVAYAMAKSPHLTSREAFRRVCDCLDYLRDRRAPLSSLMSRALVHAGVTRTLRDGVWLSTQKAQWILSLVRELEGDAVADRLDEAALTVRSENFEMKKSQMQPLQDMEREADRAAWEYRKQFGHRSHRRARKSSSSDCVASTKKRGNA
jgi:hypothetical protein